MHDRVCAHRDARTDSDWTIEDSARSDVHKVTQRRCPTAEQPDVCRGMNSAEFADAGIIVDDDAAVMGD